MRRASRIFKRFFLIASLVIGLCVSAIFSWPFSGHALKLLNDQTIAQARPFSGHRAHPPNGTAHGGVYVVKTPGMQSNVLEKPSTFKRRTAER